MKEVWKPVVGAEGWYEVSSFGNIRRSKTVRGTFNGRPLKPCKSSCQNYMVVQLSVGPGRRALNRTVHRAVADAFLGILPKGYATHHKDGNKFNNRLDNLEYITTAEHHSLHYTKKRRQGTKSVMDKDMAHAAFVLRGSGFSYYKIGRVLCVNTLTVRLAIIRSGWTHEFGHYLEKGE